METRRCQEARAGSVFQRLNEQPSMRLELLHKGSNHLTFHLHVLPPICPLLVNIDVINS